MDAASKDWKLSRVTLLVYMGAAAFLVARLRSIAHCDHGRGKVTIRICGIKVCRASKRLQSRGLRRRVADPGFTATPYYAVVRQYAASACG